MKPRQITDPKEIKSVLDAVDCCYVSMVTPEGSPYVVPMNFGYDEEYIYLHSSRIGKKIDILRHNPEVCIAFSAFHELRYQSEKVACSWSMKYKSILVYGKVEFVEEPEVKVEMLNAMMRKYAGRDFTYNAPALREVLTYRVKIEKIEGRAYRY